ncbi:hypothetical protein BKA67DRAFT_169698 [Truncatella angustata]|uniref:Uncharacterized protein n=1 Tax=Truncatella angustata TaxID=152316 RepID=A0A9P8ZZ43_9PEZI|nr:uncharacterized protein BKA67DRAFT_169698 [Truncatella angustata]KAH6656807.1 hypothetical protein BKA67DRAFT_169698 [Truncatella angustata]
MPIAESKASETITEAARSGRHFRGPFTPQLGYDGGLDYRWTTGEARAAIQVKWDIDQAHASSPSPHQKEDVALAPNLDPHSRAKRRGVHLGYNNSLDWLSDYHHTPSIPSSNRVSTAVTSSSAFQGSPSSRRRTRCQRRNLLPLENVQFISLNNVGDHTPTSHRQTTIIQISPPPLSLPAARRLPSIADDLTHSLTTKPSCLSTSSTLVPGGHNGCEF